MSKQKVMSDKEAMEIIQKAMAEYRGDLSVCESAVGALLIGRAFGWQALRVLHSSTTLNKYSDILHVDLKASLQPRTEWSRKLLGIRIADTFEKFWKALGSGALSNARAKLITTAEE